MASLWKTLGRFVLVIVPIALGGSDAGGTEKTGDDGTTGSHLGIHASGGIASYRDDLLIPISFDGPRFSLGAAYLYHGRDWRLSSRLAVGMAPLENRHGHSAYAAELELRSSWLARLTEGADHEHLWLGVCLPLLMSNVYFDSWDDSHLYWVTSYMLGVAAAWERRFDDNLTLELQLDIPIIGLVSRPPDYRYNKQEALNHLSYHFSEPNKGLQFASLGEYRAVFLQALIDYWFTSSTLRFGMEFQYQYCARPSPIQTMQTSLVVSYLWRL